MPPIDAPGPVVAAAIGAIGAFDATGARLGGFLLWLLHNSAAVAAVAGIVLLAQAACGRWLSPAWRYRLWGLVVLRLLLPALPPGPAWMPSVESLLPSRKLAAWSQRFSAQPAPPLAKPAPVGTTLPEGLPRGWGIPAGHDDLPPLPHPAAAGGPRITVRYEPLPPSAERAVEPRAGGDATPPAASPSGSLGALLTAVWLLGAAFLLCRLIAANVALARRLRAAERMSDIAVLELLDACCRQAGVARRPPLLVSDAVAAPAAAGVVRPKLVLPPGLWSTLSAAERRAVLLHELAHVRRRDVACNWLLALAQTVHWFNPALWLAFSRLRADREAARDATVLEILARDGRNEPTTAARTVRATRAPDAQGGGGAGDVARDYAQTLLKLAESVSARPSAIVAHAAGFVGIIETKPPSHPLAPGLFGSRGGLERRLHMIALFPETHRFRFAGPVLAVILGGCALTGAQPGDPAGPGASGAPPRPPRAGAPATAPAADAPATRPAADVAALIIETRHLVERRDYAAALAEVDRILAADPANDYAVGIRPLLEDKIDRGTRERAGDKANKLLREQLERKLPEVNFNNVAFSDAIDFLRDVSGANIFVNWKALEAAGIDRKTPVSARLRNVRISKALDIILDSVSKPKAKVGYTIDDGVLTITSGAELNKNVVTRVYDIRDLLVEVPDFGPEEEAAKPAPSTRPAQPTTQPVPPAPRAGARPTTAPSGAEPAKSRKPLTRQERIDQLIHLLTETVAPDSWRDKGGTVGSIKELGGQLIVTTTPENHKQLINLLEQVRETRGIQVMVESRYISCDEKVVSDLLAAMKEDKTELKPAELEKRRSEAVGQYDVYKSQAADYRDQATAGKAGAAAHAKALEDQAAQAKAEIDRYEALIEKARMRESGTPDSRPVFLPTTRPGPHVTAAFLDDAQVDQFLRVTTHAPGSAVLASPRMTLFNGQRAYVSVATSRAYVRDYTTTRTDAGETRYEPVYATAEPGLVMDVRATVSADRKYVTLTLRPKVSVLLGMTDTPWPSRPAGSSLVVQQPLLKVSELQTTASVPNQGALLLGGLEDPGIAATGATVLPTSAPSAAAPSTTAPTTRPAGRPNGLFLLVKPTILRQETPKQQEFPLLNSKTRQ